MPEPTIPTVTPDSLPLPPSAPGPEWDKVGDSPEDNFLKGAEAALHSSRPGAADLEAEASTPPPSAPAAKVLPRLKADATPATPKDELLAATVIPPYKAGTKADEWRTVHEEKNKLLQRAVAAEDAIKKFRETAAEPYLNKIKELESERTKLDSELQRIAIERSPRFQKEYQERQQAVVARASGLVAMTEREKLASTLAAAPSDARLSELEAIRANLSPLRQRAFDDLVVAHDAIAQERAEKIQAATSNWQADQTKAERDREAKLQEARTAFTNVTSGYEQKFAGTDSQEFNAEVKEAIARARNEFEQDLPIQRLSEITVQANLMPVISNYAILLSEQLQAAQDEIKRLKGADPTIGEAGDPGDTSTSSDTTADVEKFGSAGDALAADLRRAGIRL